MQKKIWTYKYGDDVIKVINEELKNSELYVNNQLIDKSKGLHFSDRLSAKLKTGETVNVKAGGGWLRIQCSLSVNNETLTPVSVITEKTNIYTNSYALCGACFGAFAGVIFEDFLWYMSWFLLGMSLGWYKDNKIMKQLKEKGYVINETEKCDDGYRITLCDKFGEKITAAVSENKMKTHKFLIGEMVYLTKSGRIVKL